MNFREYFRLLQERTEKSNLRPIAEEYYQKLLEFWDPENWMKILEVLQRAKFQDDRGSFYLPFVIRLGMPWLKEEWPLPVTISINDIVLGGNPTELSGELHVYRNSLTKKIDRGTHINFALGYSWIEDFNRLRRASKDPYRIGTKKYVEPHINNFKQFFEHRKKTVIDILTHEMQHMVDYYSNPKMGGVWGSHKMKKTKDKSEKLKVYLNSPEELNAWFRHIISGHEPKDFSSFNEYKSTIIQQYGYAWKKLTPENQQRLIKRLYQYYDNSRLT